MLPWRCCVAEGVFCRSMHFRGPTTRLTHPPSLALAFQFFFSKMNANHRFSETLFDGQNKLRHEPYLTKCWMLAINSGMKPQSGRGIDRMSTLANTFLMMKACRNRSPGFCAFTSETHTVGVRIPSQLRRREEIQKC